MAEGAGGRPGGRAFPLGTRGKRGPTPRPLKVGRSYRKQVAGGRSCVGVGVSSDYSFKRFVLPHEGLVPWRGAGGTQMAPGRVLTAQVCNRKQRV